jgi:hypothetical protein
MNFEEFKIEMRKLNKEFRRVRELGPKNKEYIRFIKNYYQKYDKLNEFWQEITPLDPMNILKAAYKCKLCEIVFYAPIENAKPIKKGKFWFCEECVKEYPDKIEELLKGATFTETTK